MHRQEELLFDSTGFVDDNGRVYLYYSGRHADGIYGVALNPKDLTSRNRSTSGASIDRTNGSDTAIITKNRAPLDRSAVDDEAQRQLLSPILGAGHGMENVRHRSLSRQTPRMVRKSKPHESAGFVPNQRPGDQRAPSNWAFGLIFVRPSWIGNSWGQYAASTPGAKRFLKQRLSLCRRCAHRASVLDHAQTGTWPD